MDTNIMNANLETTAAGDTVLLFRQWEKYPQVVTVHRTTNNFIFLQFKNTLNEFFEKKFRRLDGCIVEKYSTDHIIKPAQGEMEQWEKRRQDDLAIQELVNSLQGTNFYFRGRHNQYTVEQWRAIINAIKQ